MTLLSTQRLKAFPEDRPRTPDEVRILIRANALFVAVSAKVPDLSVGEFKHSSQAPVDLVSAAQVRAGNRTTPEAEAEAAYIGAIADHVLARRADDDEAAFAAAVRASDARGVLWGVRDRLNELVFPWADPALDDDEDGGPARLY